MTTPSNINPYEASAHHQIRKKRELPLLSIVCAIASPTCLLLTFVGMDLLVSIGLFQRLGYAGHFAYRATSIITNVAGLTGIPATLIPIFFGSPFLRRAMLAMLVIYTPIIVMVALRLPDVIARLLAL